MFAFPEARILLFAKAPAPGSVKTRLSPPLSTTDAAWLHARLVLRTLSTALNARAAPVELWSDHPLGSPFLDYCRRRFRVTFRRQCDSDLGGRMAEAFRSTLLRHPYAVLIGTDCPTLSSSHLYDALGWLKHGTRVVLTPAEDGGYGLIGLRKSHWRLFESIPWGSERVLGLTRQRLRRLAWNWEETQMLWDVDRPEDLQRLDRLGIQLPAVPRHVVQH